MSLARSAFDSDHYGIAIARWVPEPADTLAATLARARADGHAVVFVRLAEDEPRCAELAAAGHAPVDTLVTSTLVRPPPAIRTRADVAIEHHAALAGADVDAVAAITADSIATSHLHYDPKLPLERTRRIYAAWGRNDVTGRAQRVIVARHAGALIGYVAVLATPTTAVIDLIAVARAHHGGGVGSALLAAFVADVVARGPDVVATVGTQSDNPALALYGRCGFVPTARHVTYHLWL